MNNVFFKTNFRPVKTVGALIKQLEKLPKSMKISQGFGEGVKLGVYNYSETAKDLELDGPFISFEETDYD